jgi:SAM-dependent methyltransferase
MHAAFPDTAMLDRIPLWARTVLVVGCGDGALLAPYRRMNPRARLLGVEADAAAAALAARHMDEVSTADVSGGDLPFDLPEGLDCILYRGTLDDAADPVALLRRHAAALNPDGVVLAAVANPGHWRLAYRLLLGGPDAAPAAGLTPDGMRQLLQEAGLACRDVTPHEPDRDAAASFVEALAPGLEALGIDPEEYLCRAAPACLLWRARKEPRQTMILSGNMLAPVGGVSHVRVVHPLQALASDPGFQTMVGREIRARTPDDDTPRIFVLHRPALAGAQGLRTLQALRAAGYLIVTEFDDHPDHFEVMRRSGYLSFRGVHALQTSTAAMAEALRPYNPEIAVFPNGMVSLPEVRNFSDPGRMTLFFGALNRENDWQALMPAINAVAATAGERLAFQVVHDRRFFDALDTPHKAFTPTCDYETYLHLLGGCEICFMPLSDTPFNRAKSDLKFIESAACRVAPLASTVVYGDSIEDERTGLLFRDPAEFHAQLLRLVATPDHARELGDVGRRHVAAHRMLSYQVAPRSAWYRSLWARREALTEALRARLGG